MRDVTDAFGRSYIASAQNEDEWPRVAQNIIHSSSAHVNFRPGPPRPAIGLVIEEGDTTAHTHHLPPRACAQATFPSELEHPSLLCCRHR